MVSVDANQLRLIALLENNRHFKMWTEKSKLIFMIHHVLDRLVVFAMKHDFVFY